jgi:uncharacterized phage-associated protein
MINIKYYAYGIRDKVKLVMLAPGQRYMLQGGIEMSRSDITAYDVANAFVKLSDPESGDVLTNLKLQKLVYYAQGFHLAMFDEPLFADSIVAWEHGPVVVDLYHKLKDYRASQVTISDPLNTELTPQQIGLLKEINNVFGQFSAWKLRNMTHNESPWQNTERDEEISHEKLKAYFKTQLQ